MVSFNFYKGKKKSNSFRKRNYNKKRQQLLSVKTVEDIAKKTAQEVARDHRVTLIKRTYYPVVPDVDDGTFNNANNVPQYIEPTFEGLVSCLSNLRKLDNSAVQTVAPVSGNDPLTGVNEVAEAQLEGANNVSPTLPHHGRRASHQIKLTGCSLSVRALTKGFMEPDPTTAEQNYFGYCILKYAIVAARWEGMDTVNNGAPAVDGVPNAYVKPEAAQLLKMNIMGYSSQLDDQSELEASGLKVKTLCKGQLKLKYGTQYIDEKMDTIYAKFSKPMLLGWRPDDQTGERANKWKLYAVFRSTIGVPATGGGKFQKFVPNVQAVSKLYYHDV